MTGAGSGGVGTDAGTGDEFGRARWMAVRAALEPLWVVAQGEWGDVHEGPPSQGMARYTAEFVARLAPGWRVVTGLVHDGGGWSLPHAWNEHAVTGAVVDLTGDQHGRAPVQFRADLPAGYLPSPCPPDGRGGNLYRDRATVWLIDLERLADRSRSGDDRAGTRRADVGVWCPCCGCWEEVADTIVSADRSRLWCCSWCDAADPSGQVWREVLGACYGDGHPGPATTPPTPPSRSSRPDGWGWAS